MSKLASAIEATMAGFNTIKSGKLDQAEPGLLGTVSSMAEVMPNPNPPKQETTDVGSVGMWSVPAPDGGQPRPFTGQWPPDPKDIKKQAAKNIANASQLQFLRKAAPSLFTKPTMSKSKGGIY